MLIELPEDRRDLPLAEGIIEGVVDQLRGYPQSPECIAVDLQRRARRRGLQVTGYILQFG
jgi:hypothetical protein